jgi:hypothetical protein
LPSEYAQYFETANEFILQNADKNDRDIKAQRARGLVAKHSGCWSEYSTYFLSREAKSMALPERSQFDIESRGHFYAFVEQMKVRRGTDFLKTFPDMTDFYYMCKKQFEETGTP